MDNRVLLNDWRHRRERNAQEAQALSDELDRLVARAQGAGLSVPEIAKATGLSRQALHQRLKKGDSSDTDQSG